MAQGTLAAPDARLAARRLGLRVEVALLQAEGVHAQHVGAQRVVARPLGQHAGDPLAQVARVAAVEVEQVRPLQRVAGRADARSRICSQAAQAPCQSPAAQRSRSAPKWARSRSGAWAASRLGLVERGARIGHQRGLGQRRAGSSRASRAAASSRGSAAMAASRSASGASKNEHMRHSAVSACRSASLRRRADRVAARVVHVAQAAGRLRPGPLRRPQLLPGARRPAARRGRRSAARRSAGRSAGRPRCSRS